MKIILYMAMSVNGFIARKNGSTDFVSDVEWESFRDTVAQTGNIIIGRKTYEIMKKDDEFGKLDSVRVVVVSEKTIKTNDQNHSVVAFPKDAILFLEKSGFKEALVAGGGVLDTSFIKDNLIDEIYLDIEPIVFGKGATLFSESDFENNLELLGVEKMSKNELQLHYKVIK